MPTGCQAARSPLKESRIPGGDAEASTARRKDGCTPGPARLSQIDEDERLPLQAWIEGAKFARD